MHWITRGRDIVAAAEEGVKRFDAEATRFEEVMKDVKPADGVSLPVSISIPKAASAPVYRQDFAGSFDPRENPPRPESDGVVVTKVEGGTRTTTVSERR